MRPVSIYTMVAGALAIITTGSKSILAVYRGKYTEYYGKKGMIYTQRFAGEDPLVFSHQQKDGGWTTRYYFFKNSQVYIEWLT